MKDGKRDQPDVDWLDGDAHGEPAVDELVIGRDRAPMRRRTRLTLAAIGTAAVIGVVVITLVGNDTKKPVAGPSPSLPSFGSGLPASRVPASLVPASLVPASLVPESLAASPSPIRELPGNCDVISGGGLGCSINDRVPSAVLSALRTVLPGATPEPPAVTVTGPSRRLLNRHVSVRSDAGTLSVDVLPAGEALAEPAPSSPPVPAADRFQLDDGEHSITVTISTIDPDYLPARTVLARLARDPRLLSVER
ncbi:MAG: hypothetical protein ACR2LX_08185 [Jatrophihabitans sp.]